jgi:hypothetical protein
MPSITSIMRTLRQPSVVEARLRAALALRRSTKSGDDGRGRSGIVRVPVGSVDTVERFQRELPAEIIRWSRQRSVQIVDVMPPAVVPRPGQRFVAPGRRADGFVVFAHCEIAPRVWWRPWAVAVRFTIMERHRFNGGARDA